MSDTTTSRPITPKTSVSIELVMVLLTALFAGGGGVVWINNELAEVQISLKEIHHRLSALEKGQILLDRWTHTDMVNWVELLQASNPSVKVPKVAR